MPKEHHKHRKGEGVKIAGNPGKLIDLMIKGDSRRKWAADQLINEGPKHKQVLTSLLIQRLYKLVKTIEKSSGKSFELQEGVFLKYEKDDESITLPLATPLNLSPAFDKKKVAEAISYAPEHETLAYTISLQVIEWAIKNIAAIGTEVQPAKSVNAVHQNN